jgi:hypothetical protein
VFLYREFWFIVFLGLLFMQSISTSWTQP